MGQTQFPLMMIISITMTTSPPTLYGKTNTISP